MANAEVARAEGAALEHGLQLEWGDHEWPMMRRRIVSLAVERDGEIVARASQTYSDDAGKERARAACAGVLFVRA